MKFRQLIILIILILGGLVFIINEAFLYAGIPTHSNLTREMALFYNYYYAFDLSPSQIEWMRQGSVDEDIWPRNWYYHFYDPIHNRGFGPLSAKEWAQNPQEQAKYPGGDHTWQKAISDYNSGYKKEAFISLGHILHLIEDMAVPAHTREDSHPDGDPLEKWAADLPEHSAFYDIAVPLVIQGIKPKVFNNLDAYFDEVANFSNNNFFSKDTVTDTINKYGEIKSDAKYSRPRIVKEGWKDGKEYAYGKVIGSSKLIRLAEIRRNNYGEKNYFLDDNTSEIQVDYFSLLSKEAVINGAGIIKLFFDSVIEPEKEIIESGTKASLFDKIINGIKEGAKFVYSAFYGLFHTPPYAVDSVIDSVTPDSEYLATNPWVAKEIKSLSENNEETATQTSVGIGESQVPVEVEHPKVYQVEESEEIFKVEKVIDGDTIVLENGQKVRYIGINAPELPNGCFAQESLNKNKELVEGKQVKLKKDVSETDNYDRLLRYIYLDSLFINDYLVRNGYAYAFSYEPDVKYKEQLAQAEKEAKENRLGLWGDACHPEYSHSGGGSNNSSNSGGVGGSSAVTDETNNQSQDQGNSQDQEQDEQEEDQQNQDQELSDIISPIISNIEVKDITESSALITWHTDEDSDSLAEYGLNSGSYNFTAFGSTLASGSFEFIHTIILDDLDDNTIYYYKISSTDENQNKAESEEKSFRTLELIPVPDPVDNLVPVVDYNYASFSFSIIINEIAWMGTEADFNDEWIELYNKSDYNINLASLSLEAEDGSPSINLTGSIPAKGYYLIERISENDEPDDATSISADWYGSFGLGLNNSGENLFLKDSQGKVVDQVNCSAGWYAGQNKKEGEKWIRKAMERISPDELGTNAENWQTYTGSGSGAIDVGGNPIFGTPKAENSIGNGDDDENNNENNDNKNDDNNDGIIYVDDDFDDDPENHHWNTIQEGIDDAKEGDTIIVKQGTYNENIKIEKANLIINSERGAEDTIVKPADPKEHIFEITASSVEIKGFTIQGTNSPGKAAIYLNEANNLLISDNKFLKNYIGIYLSDSSGNSLENNSFDENRQGIYLENSETNTIFRNTINSKHNTHNQITCGIYLKSSNQNTLQENVANDQGLSNNIDNGEGHGICLIFSHNNLLENNTANNNKGTGDGIYLSDSNENNLKENIVSDNKNGITLRASNGNSLDNNKAENNKTGIYISSGSRNNVLTNNLMADNIISNFNLAKDQSDIIVDSSSNAGLVYVINSENITIKDLVIDGRNEKGIYFYKTNNSTIENIKISNSVTAVYLEYSYHNIITKNSIKNNWQGIALNRSDSNTISQNILEDNQGIDDQGIGISPVFAIQLSKSNGNEILDNNLKNNPIGLRLMSSSKSNTLSGNTIENNAIGVEVYASNNLFYHNNLIDNGNNNKYDVSPPLNQWYHPDLNQGNYYSDYDESGEGCDDSNNDGFCDETYLENNDLYPFASPDFWLTAGSKTSPSSASEIKIIDIFYHGVEQNEADEYVEIKNIGETTQDLEGWTLSDVAEHTYTFPSHNFLVMEVVWLFGIMTAIPLI